MLQEKHFLNKAKELINSGKEENLKYACLDLRMCIETLCYSKIGLYLKQIPEEILKSWQPRKLMLALKELDPHVEVDRKVVICMENEKGNPMEASFVGCHKSITIKFIRDIYDKLGYFLHIPSILQLSQHSKKLSDLRADLNNLIPKLEDLCSSNFITNLAPVITFKCKRCGSYNLKNKEAIKKKNVFICSEENCKVEYKYVDNNGSPTFLLAQVICNCPDCNTQIVYDKHKLKEGLIIKCKKCRKQLMFNRTWEIKALDNIKNPNVKKK